MDVDFFQLFRVNNFFAFLETINNNNNNNILNNYLSNQIEIKLKSIKIVHIYQKTSQFLTHNLLPLKVKPLVFSEIIKLKINLLPEIKRILSQTFDVKIWKAFEYRFQLKIFSIKGKFIAKFYANYCVFSAFFFLLFGKIRIIVEIIKRLINSMRL